MGHAYLFVPILNFGVLSHYEVTGGTIFEQTVLFVLSKYLKIWQLVSPSTTLLGAHPKYPVLRGILTVDIPVHPWLTNLTLEIPVARVISV